MVYNVYRTDGNLLTTVNDGTVNTITSLQLVGIGYAGYSKAIAENLVQIMENFSNVSAPLYPVVGQLWWDKNNKKINVYDGDTFRPINNVIFSTLSPNLPQNGDFWYDTTNEQLKIFNDSWTAIYPDYTASQGISGQVIKTITDDNETEHVVTVEYNNNAIVAVYSTDSTFITGDLPGITEISPGVNLAYGYEFNGTARRSRISEGLALLAHSQYMHANTDTFTSGNISVNGGKIIFGNSEANPSVSYVENKDDTYMWIHTDFSKMTLQNTVFINEEDINNRLVGIGNEAPQYNLDIIGSAALTENLYVTSINNNNGVYWDTTTQTGVIHNDSKLYVLHGDSHVTLQESGDVSISRLIVDNTTTTNNITNFGQVTNASLPVQPYHLANKQYVDQADTQNRLPIGSVIMWYGAAIDVPSGWNICDGTNGTPDLTNAFVFGAGGSASVGDTGGNNSQIITTSSAGVHNHSGSTDTGGSHNHTGTTGVHTLTIDQIPSHAHSLPHVVAIAGGGFGEEWDGSGGYKATTTGNVGGGSGHQHTISSDGSHSHEITTSTTGAHTHSVSFDNRPSWVALYYIMRVS